MKTVFVLTVTAYFIATVNGLELEEVDADETVLPPTANMKNTKEAVKFGKQFESIAKPGLGNDGPFPLNSEQVRSLSNLFQATAKHGKVLTGLVFDGLLNALTEEQLKELKKEYERTQMLGIQEFKDVLTKAIRLYSKQVKLVEAEKSPSPLQRLVSLAKSASFRRQ